MIIYFRIKLMVDVSLGPLLRKDFISISAFTNFGTIFGLFHTLQGEGFHIKFL